MDFCHYKQNLLHCEDIPVPALAQKYGTPLYLYSQRTLLHHLSQIQKAFASANPLICYSLKTNPNLSICKLMREWGAGFDVTSAGELHRALKAGGTGDVTKDRLLWTKHAGSNVVSPAIYEDHLYWLNEDGKAYCLRAKDGEQVYAEHVKGGAYASVTIADGKIYAVTKKDGVYVLAAGPKFEQLAHNSLSDDSTFNASPAVTGSRLLIRSDLNLYCLGPK